MRIEVPSCIKMSDADAYDDKTVGKQSFLSLLDEKRTPFHSLYHSGRPSAARPVKVWSDQEAGSVNSILSLHAIFASTRTTPPR